MTPRKLSIQHYPSSIEPVCGTLLFVHGAYVNSTCWEFFFIPFFQQRGYRCFTLDLSGHGASEGRERIEEFGIDDYVEDLKIAIATAGGAVTVVAHSMGCRVLERFLERAEVEAAIFMAPIPTTGTAGSAVQLIQRYPAFLKVLDDAVNRKISREAGEVMTRVYFSPDVTPEETLRYLPMIGPESHRAVLEMAVPDVRWSVRRRRPPALVIGGSEDAVFPISMLHFFASTWRAEMHRVEGAGHMLMLDPRWEGIAEHMLAWLAALTESPRQTA
jgi:pimeloyl-ACP methyl ester carboxylesterase